MAQRHFNHMDNFFAAFAVHINFIGEITHFSLFQNFPLALGVSPHGGRVLLGVRSVDAFIFRFRQHHLALLVKIRHDPVYGARINAQGHIVQNALQQIARLQQIFFLGAARSDVFIYRQYRLQFARGVKSRNFGDGKNNFSSAVIFKTHLAAGTVLFFLPHFFVQYIQRPFQLRGQQAVYFMPYRGRGCLAEHFFGFFIPYQTHTAAILHGYGKRITVHNGFKETFFFDGLYILRGCIKTQ